MKLKLVDLEQTITGGEANASMYAATLVRILNDSGANASIAVVDVYGGDVSNTSANIASTTVLSGSEIIIEKEVSQGLVSDQDVKATKIAFR